MHAWVERVAAKRGRRIAVVALARRLSRILYAIWRDQSVFDVFQVPPPSVGWVGELPVESQYRVAARTGAADKIAKAAKYPPRRFD